MIDATFDTDTTQKNWYPISVPQQHIPSDFFFQHQHDPDLKTALPEIRTWLAGNCRYRWEMQFAKGFDGGVIHYCRVIFRAKIDAALFKMIWT